MRSSSLSVAFAIGLVVLISFVPSPFSPVRRTAASSVTVFSDDFEGSFPGAGWTVRDEQPQSGLDYWGVNSAIVPAHGGQNSVWCAQVGMSSITGNPNSQDGVYDDNMNAVVQFQTPDLSGYAGVTLTFWVWYSIGPTDYLRVSVSPDGTTYTSVSSVGQGTSNNWEQNTLSIPLDTRYVQFLFFSDAATESVGALVDDVALVGTDSTAPTIAHTPITSATVGQSIAVTADITDNVAVAGATLYYESVGESTFASLPMNVNGNAYSATIPAQASAGSLRYYIEARDMGGNVARSPSGGAGSPYLVTVSVPETSAPPIALIAIVIIVLVAVLVVAVLAMRRRKAKGST